MRFRSPFLNKIITSTEAIIYSRVVESNLEMMGGGDGGVDVRHGHSQRSYENGFPANSKIPMRSESATDRH